MIFKFNFKLHKPLYIFPIGVIKWFLRDCLYKTTTISCLVKIIININELYNGL